MSEGEREEGAWVWWGGDESRAWLESQSCSAVVDQVSRTFVFEEIAHASASREHELRDVFDDFRLVLGREGGEPFR